MQLRATESRSAARHARQTCPPGVLHLKPREQKRKHPELLQEEAIQAFIDLASLGERETYTQSERGSVAVFSILLPFYANPYSAASRWRRIALSQSLCSPHARLTLAGFLFLSQTQPKRVRVGGED